MSKILALGLCTCVFPILAGESLTLPPLLTDHAVIQRDRPWSLSGRAAADVTVQVRLAGSETTAKAAANGAWSVTLPALPAGGPHVLEIAAGGERQVVSDLLVGDVWLCSGQSNMGVGLAQINEAKRRLAALDTPGIRLLKMRGRVCPEPQNDPDPAQEPWKECTAANAEGFSAVAIAFAHAVRSGGERVPIGLIQSNRAGTFCEAWIPRAAMAAEADGARILARWDWLDAQRERLITAWQGEHAAWVQAHGQRFEQWKRMPIGGAFQPHEPGKPAAADSPLRPGVLWNGMIAPLTGTAVRGVLWYQGESNTDRAFQYRVLLARLVASWRQAWGDPGLPFIIAQLPEFEADTCPYDWQDCGSWEVLRESQAVVARDVPGVSLAVMLGLGERRDIHPKAKWEVGERMAQAALAQVYGRKVAWTGPRPVGFQREQGRMLIRLADVGAGVVTLDGGSPRGFVIAGADRTFVPATAEIIAADTIAVSAAAVPDPQAVRYAWDDHPDFNLTSSTWQVMGPFRSDDWPLPTQGAVVPFHRTYPEP